MRLESLQRFVQLVILFCVSRILLLRILLQFRKISPRFILLNRDGTLGSK